MSDKGDPILFVKGKYKGKTGWYNQEKGSTRTRHYIIVDMGHNVLIRTWVNKASARPAVLVSPPTSYSEAVLQQCPDVEEKLEKLCTELAMCKIDKDPNGILAIINQKLAEACQTQASKTRALYRVINYQANPMAATEL